VKATLISEMKARYRTAAFDLNLCHPSLEVRMLKADLAGRYRLESNPSQKSGSSTTRLHQGDIKTLKFKPRPLRRLSSTLRLY
jgi:hypothetical protein